MTATVTNFSTNRPKNKSNVQRRNKKQQVLTRTDRSRVERLKPIVLNEILEKFSDTEYFTRDHLLYFSVLRQFSMSYKITLVREIVNHFISVGTLIRCNKIDICVSTPENQRKQRANQRNKIPAYSGSYTTRSADELLSGSIEPKIFTVSQLADWLVCLENLAPSTKLNYARRIVDDLLRRNILNRQSDTTYSVNV